VFSRTKHGADKIARKLKAANHSVAVLHANRSQNQRIEALAGFKSGKYEVMVATDIAARGIDVAGVTHVINYDVPENPEDYVHRIGRTGRAQAVGDAFTLVTPDNAGDVRDIERFIGQKIPQLKLDGFDYKPLAGRPPQAPQPPRGGQRGGGRPNHSPRGHGHGQGQGRGQGGGHGGQASSRAEPRRDERSATSKPAAPGGQGDNAQPRGFPDRGTPEQRRRSFWRR
jgi:ATP-dependent RNA helicase RhlE